MSKAFGNGKRNISGTERARQLNDLHNYNFAKNLAKDKCKYIQNKSLNNNFTIEYKYTEDSLVSQIRNTESYGFLYSMLKGYNLCECNSIEHNVKGDLIEIQKYGYEDLSGISLYDTDGNKLFDEYFYEACGLTDYTKYDVVKIQNKKDLLNEQSTYLSNFKVPCKIFLNEEYARPSLSIISVIPTNNYAIELPLIKILTTIDECFNNKIQIENVTISLLQRVTLSTEIIGSIVNYIYGLEQRDNSILQGTLLSNKISDIENEFSNISIHKPGLNYILKFSNSEVQDICSNFINVYGNFKNLKGNGFDNSEINNSLFTDTQTTNQGSYNNSIKVTFVPTIEGDYYYQSQYNNDIFGLINVTEPIVQISADTHEYFIETKTTSTTVTGKQYFLTEYNTGITNMKPTIDINVGDTLIFDISGDITLNPLWIQTSQGSRDGITVIEDASGILGIAGKTINSISMEILDNLDNKFSVADNEVNIQIDPVSNFNSAELNGNKVKFAEFGTITFDDLSFNKPGTNYKFTFFTSNGEIDQFTTTHFDILGELEEISVTPVRNYYVGEIINNIGCKMLLSEDDNSTEVTYTISNGVLHNNSSYVNDFTASMFGINEKTLVDGEILVDNSVNKIGNNFNIIFQAPNTSGDLISSNINIIGKTDVSNTNGIDSNPEFVAGTDLSNFEIRLLDVNDNIIPFNSDVYASVKFTNENSEIETLFDKIITITDGSSTLVDISINVSKAEYYIELSIEHGDGSKNTIPFNIFSNADISSQPLIKANKIVGSDFMPINFSSKNSKGETIPEIVSYTIDTFSNGDILNGTKTLVSDENGVVEFRTIEFLKSTTDTSYNIRQLEITGTNAIDNVKPFVTSKFYILYDNWRETQLHYIAPGINTLTNANTDYYIQLDQDYRPYDNSYVLLVGGTPQDNVYWKTNTTSIPGNAYMRSLVWDISNGDISAGGIYRIKRKSSYGSPSSYPAEFSFTPIEEVQTAISENRSPNLCYYDYHINTNILSRENHEAAASALTYDSNIYEDTGWALTSIRSQEESDLLSYKLKAMGTSAENLNYYIGGKLSTRVFSEIDPLAAGPYGNVLYTWDTPGETDNYIWVGYKTILMPL